MRRGTIPAASRSFAALAFILLFICGFARGQSLPSKKDLTKWVEAAEKSNSLLSEDLPSYHFVANVRYTLSSNAAPLEGTFEVLWAAPDRYRVEFRLGKIGETDLVLKDKKYVIRNTPMMMLSMWSISDFLFSKIKPVGSPNPQSLTDISSIGDGASRQICLTAGDTTAVEHRLCFDANTTELISEHHFPNPHGFMAKFPLAADLTDYTNLGKTRYPQHLMTEYGPQKIEAVVEKWEAVAGFAEDLFTPPPKATVWDWCADPKLKAPAYRTTVPALPVLSGVRDPKTGEPSMAYVAVYKVVGTNGFPKQVTELFAPPGKLAEKFVDDQHHVRSDVRICDGKPIEYETVDVYWPLGPYTFM